MFFYIHIPFCRQKCLYCKFALTPEYNALKIETYLSALRKEIHDFFTEFPDVSIETIYFGGGTPSVLSPLQIEGILSIFRAQAWFARISEIILEANPEDITREYIEELQGLGINRLSLGIQTLNEASLQRVGRADLNESIFRALGVLKQGSFENISIDLIAGLPETNPGQIVHDLELIFEHIEPKHVSIYMLEDESYPAQWKAVLPSEEGTRNEYMDGNKWLENRGFHRYELSNFALPGFESKHNRAYWNHSEYRGFWLSAASFFGGKRFANHSSFVGYYAGKKHQEETLSEESFCIERLMFGLRTSGVSIGDIENKDKLSSLVDEWLLEIREDKVFPTSTWIFIIDYIIGELM